ncbi:MAG: acyloxyacyl hydrolase [Pyrinomonadaceae bacterium]|nr:acyloxyacyl hydrolase [Pyrinomonadaceae bacterium]
MKFIIIKLLLLACLPSSATAQAKDNETDGFQLLRGEKELNVEMGFSPIQPTFLSGRKEYDTSGRKLLATSFHFGRVIGTKRGVTYEYMFEVSPFAVALNNEVRNKDFVSATQTPNISPTKRRTSYGAGFQPAVFKFTFMPKKRVKPFARVGAGMIFFNDNFPTSDATKYNFTGEFGGGVQFHTSRKRALNVGYKYFHISNFNTSRANPGYNANVVYVGYSLFR